MTHERVKHPKLHNPIEKHFLYVSRYHYLLWGLVFLTKWPIGSHFLSLIFISPPMDFHCNGKDDAKNTCPCKEPVWNRTVFTETMQTKFSLQCDKQWLISFSESIFYLGVLIGSFIFGFMSDRYGRLKMYCVSFVTVALSGSLVPVMPSVGWFILFRCFEGIGIGAAIVTGFVLCIEYCGVTHREAITALYHIPINLGCITTAGVSYLLRNVDDFQLTLSVPIFFCVLIYLVIQESPKWLMDSDNIDKAAEVMKKISDFNKQPCENIREELAAYHTNHTIVRGKKIYIWHLFRHRKLTVNLVCMSLLYFVSGLGYYGVSQFIGQMSGNIHLNVAISGLILIPGTTASVFLLKVLGRRTILMTTNLLSGFFMILVVTIDENLIWVRVLCASLCNTFFFISFIIVFLYGVELFPTSIRNSVLGVLSVLSRVGQMAGPPTNNLPQYASGSIYSCVALLAAVICLTLPETKDTELPSTLEDSKTFTRKRVHLQEVDAGTSTA